MTTHAKLLAILVTASRLGLSATVAADGTSKDTRKGAWKFEIDRQDQPALSYYDTRGKTVFRIGCGAICISPLAIVVIETLVSSHFGAAG